ncbi:MAG TPA: tagaturonate epimerase family protein [Clostridia bacterium]|nr:tagaturonate epimerase family protein [Clostridia bacterium]
MTYAYEKIREICAALGARPYEKSFVPAQDGFALMADRGDEDCLVLSLPGAPFEGEQVSAVGEHVLLVPLTHGNAEALRARFPFAAPSPVLTKERTLGVGDRLGIAGPGHIRAFERYDAYPVLAQQSIRELTLTGRTFEDVLDCASFAVFREGFRRGFGADGDHLKKPEEVEYAIRCGYTMITLDCSEHIRNDISSMTDAEVEALPDTYAELYRKYDGMEADVEGTTLRFGGIQLRRTLHIYGAALDFAVSIYERFIKGAKVDFEISIDETETPTSPLQHFFVASELVARGVSAATVAPRFCGEFQKGIDYIGDLARFEAEFAVHAAIARRFGYKISVHSGSDKFSVFPAVGRETRGRFHVKTAGTNWLEAMRLTARVSPSLYREIHAFALAHFVEAKRYYHVTTDLSKIPPLASLSDGELPALFDLNEARQLIHITYGLILSAGEDAGSLFKTRLYELWRAHADEYAALLSAHIGKHLELLGVERL